MLMRRELKLASDKQRQEEGRSAGAEWRGREWSSPGQLTAAARVRLEIRVARKLKRPDDGGGFHFAVIVRGL